MTRLAAILLALVQGDPAPPPLEPRVASYVRQLREESTRDRARDRLVHLGRPALALLEKTEVDPAVLASIQQEVALNESLGSAYGPPHTFSFDGAEEPVGVLLAKIESGAGITFQKNSFDLSQKVSLRMEDATFWEALDELCRKGSIWYSPMADQLSLNGGMASAKPRSYYGPFLIVMDRLVQQRKILFDRIDADYQIRLTCAWERHVVPLGPTGKITLVAVTDDTGASLLPSTPLPQATRPLGAYVDITGLLAPSPGARKLARVEGSLELEFPVRVDELRIEIQGDSPSATREIEGATIELRSFAPQSSWGAAAEFVFRFKDPKEAAGCKMGPTNVEFIGPGDARRRGMLGAPARDSEKGTLSFTAYWPYAGRQELPKEVRLRIPRGSVIKTIPFCYRDVDLK